MQTEIEEKEIRARLDSALAAILTEALPGTVLSEYQLLKETGDELYNAVHRRFYNMADSEEDEEDDDDMSWLDDFDDGEMPAPKSTGMERLPYGLLASAQELGYKLNSGGGVIECELSSTLTLRICLVPPGQYKDISYRLNFCQGGITAYSALRYVSNALTGEWLRILVATAAKHGRRLHDELDEKVSEMLVARQERRIFETALPHFVKVFGKKNEFQCKVDFTDTEFDADAVLHVKLSHNKRVSFPISMDGFSEELGIIMPVVSELRRIQHDLTSEFSVESITAICDRIDRIESQRPVSAASNALTAATSYVSLGSAEKATLPIALKRSVMAELTGREIRYALDGDELRFDFAGFEVSLRFDDKQRAIEVRIEFHNSYYELTRTYSIPPSQCVDKAFVRFVRKFLDGAEELAVKLDSLLEIEYNSKRAYYQFCNNVRATVDAEVLGCDFNHILIVENPPRCVGFLHLELDKDRYLTLRLIPSTYKKRIKAAVEVCSRVSRLRKEAGIAFHYRTYPQYMKWTD